METITQWIAEYGYFGLFSLLVVGIVGVPVPDEALLTFSGYLIHKGQFHWPAALATAYAGSACGISLSYILGYTFGWWLICKVGWWVHMTEQRVKSVHRWFERYGRWTLVFGYFIPGIRHAIAYTAGMSRMRYRSFALFAYTGAAIWGTTFLVLGYLAGPAWQDTFAVVQRGHSVVLIGLPVILVIVLAVWFLRRHRGDSGAKGVP